MEEWKWRDVEQGGYVADSCHDAEQLLLVIFFLDGGGMILRW